MYFLYFILSFMMGVIYNMIIKPDNKIVIKYPTKYNSDLIYKDDADICYKYILKEEKCPLDKSNVFKMPIQLIR